MWGEGRRVWHLARVLHHPKGAYYSVLVAFLTEGRAGVFHCEVVLGIEKESSVFGMGNCVRGVHHHQPSNGQK